MVAWGWQALALGVGSAAGVGSVGLTTSSGGKSPMSFK